MQHDGRGTDDCTGQHSERGPQPPQPPPTAAGAAVAPVCDLCSSAPPHAAPDACKCSAVPGSRV